MRLLACQTAIPTTRTRNEQLGYLTRLAQDLRQAARHHQPDLIVLPELSSQEYSDAAFDHLDQLDDDLKGPVVQLHRDLASELGCFIAFGLARRAADTPAGLRRHISQVVVGPDGEISAVYDKLHCAQFGASAEAGHFVPGDRLVTFDVAGWRVGVMICYDLRFGELAARYRQQGVDLMLHPVAFTRDFSFASWHSFITTRAMEHQCYWLSLNRAGDDWGHSTLCPPLLTADIPAQPLSHQEGIVCRELDRQQLMEARARLPLARDRRDDIDRLPVHPLP
ncbi:carbon-nitrogen hydrolase family protein [Halomonas cupida]|uniref:carbon-nitrogen hydrolase family protein n=1 Tax=Halomonas TaxID=2745 RepID=UPI001A8CAE32|nr:MULTISPECIES: carbon-nitrogen hydrolase family protein [Halomonas]MBN8411557.1 carbon-nitrogen hydrolase family protein [Halomonas litopenaei]MBY5928081.1 carbon-nitrogen hydrolase family protein [Halomonas sp. DP8Y7-3]MBY5982874.1 carbon-nitrogen hydrolase family protein [Halomonas sp. DP5Y7-2]